MPLYRANAHVLNLKPGDEFESDDPFYTAFADGGYLDVLDEEPVEEEPPVEEPVEPPVAAKARKSRKAAERPSEEA